MPTDTEELRQALRIALRYGAGLPGKHYQTILDKLDRLDIAEAALNEYQEAYPRVEGVLPHVHAIMDLEEKNEELRGQVLALKANHEPVATVRIENVPSGHRTHTYDWSRAWELLPTGTYQLFTKPPLPEVTDEMALAFHQATTDGSIGAGDMEEIKAGLCAALAGIAKEPTL